MTKSKEKIKQQTESSTINSGNINKGKTIYYKNILHYIVYEFEGQVLISKSEDLSKAFCVSKSVVSVKPKK